MGGPTTTRPRPAVRASAPPVLVHIARVEASSYLVLVALAVWRATGGPNLSTAMGLVHGVIFLVYLALVLRHRPAMGWTNDDLAAIVGLAIVPLGGFWVASRILAPAVERVPGRTDGVRSDGQGGPTGAESL